jgi:hypothetical protein
MLWKTRGSVFIAGQPQELEVLVLKALINTMKLIMDLIFVYTVVLKLGQVEPVQKVPQSIM